jgi:hypothetical protein
MQRCYVHVEDDHESGARVVARKSPIAAEQSKKRAGSSRANESPKDSTRKHRHMVRDWSKDKAEEDVSAYMLNPQKKRSEQTIQGGLTPPAKGARGPDATSGADAQHEDSGRENQAATTGWRPGFLHRANKPRATMASCLHHHTSKL